MTDKFTALTITAPPETTTVGHIIAGETELPRVLEAVA
jgi:hypothetical protein